MSGHFSYELDERQIRLMMCDAELEEDASFWDKFESMNHQETKTSFEFKLPKFHISQSVFIPVLFVIVIALLSVVLFNFVDFKKTEKVIEENQYHPIIKPVSINKKVSPKPVIAPQEKLNIVVIDSALIAQQRTDSIKQAIELTKTKEFEFGKELVDKKDTLGTAPTVSTNIKKQKTEPRKKKRRKRVVGEEIPTIASPIRLEENSVEPDLDLK